MNTIFVNYHTKADEPQKIVLASGVSADDLDDQMDHLRSQHQVLLRADTRNTIESEIE